MGTKLRLIDPGPPIAACVRSPTWWGRGGSDPLVDTNALMKYDIAETGSEEIVALVDKARAR